MFFCVSNSMSANEFVSEYRYKQVTPGPKTITTSTRTANSYWNIVDMRSYDSERRARECGSFHDREVTEVSRSTKYR